MFGTEPLEHEDIFITNEIVPYEGNYNVIVLKGISTKMLIKYNMRKQFQIHKENFIKRGKWNLESNMGTLA